MKNINAIYSLIISNLKKLSVIYNKNNYKKEQSFYTNKSDIIKWLDRHKITNYKLIEDDKYGYVVDVSSNVKLSLKGLGYIPVKFGNVGGYFYCYHNNLTSLQFCPATIGGSFHCSNNNLTSLEFCPTAVNDNFVCYNNKITNLIYFPSYIGNDIYLASNNLIGIDMNKYYKFEELYQMHIGHKINAEKTLLNNFIGEIIESSPKGALSHRTNQFKI